MAINLVGREIENIAKTFALSVCQEIDVQKVLLYGSYAKGDFSKDSDIDIAVVSNDFTGDPIEDIMKLMRIRRKIDKRIEPRAIRSEDFNRNNPLSKEIIDTGIEII